MELDIRLFNSMQQNMQNKNFKLWILIYYQLEKSMKGLVLCR